MVVMPINGALSSHRANSYMSFAGRRDNANDSNENFNAEGNRASANLAKVPVVVLMAMSPAMLNANQPETKAATRLAPKVEVVQNMPEVAEVEDMSDVAPFEAPEIQQGKVTAPLGQMDLFGKRVVLHETFMNNGKKYHLVFTQLDHHRKDLVDQVYIYPDGFKSEYGVSLPRVTEFIVHNVPGQELWGSVVIRESKMDKIGFVDTYKDVRLPDGPAQKILDLIQDSTDFTDNSKVEYSRTNSAALRKTVVKKSYE